MKARLLDLFCGAGGAAVGYQRAGFEVVGVDIAPQPNYPFEFWQYDVLPFLENWLLGEQQHELDPYPTIQSRFDAIHASPPCQGYSKMGGPNNTRLIPSVRELLVATGLPYVIENIEDARDQLIDPVMLCGTMFDPTLNGLKRHRLFETNWNLCAPEWPCRHKLAAPRFRVYDHGKWYLSQFVPVYGDGGGKAKEHWPAALGIDWMTDAEMKEAIPPRYTEFVGSQLLQHVRSLRQVTV